MEKHDKVQTMKAYWNSKKIVNEFTEAKEPEYWKEFFSNIKHPPNFTVLDLGCGGGRNTYMLVNLGFKVEACDLHEKMLEATKKKISALENKNVHVWQANMLKLPYKAESLDIVLSNGIYHNTSSLDEFEQAISETSRVLKKGGLLCLNVFTDAFIDESLVKQNEDFLFITPDGLDMILLPPKRILDILNNNSLLPHSETVFYNSQINIGIRSVLRGVFYKK